MCAVIRLRDGKQRNRGSFPVEATDDSPTTPSSTLDRTQPSVHWTSLAISQGTKQAGREAHHTSLYGANVKNNGSHTSILHRLSRYARGQFYV